MPTRLGDLRIETLKRGLAEGKLSRRAFIEGAVALGATLSMAAALASEAEAATPRKGGALRVGLGHGSTTDSLDPGTYENGFMTVLDYCLHNHLTEVAPSGELVPELAESWEASPDATQWTFILRKGVEFHNGKSLTAGDVVASIDHHRGEDTKSAAKPIVAPIKSVKADGEHTVVFTLKGGNADFPFIMSDRHLAIQPARSNGSMDWQAGIGVGPYRLGTFEPGVRATVARNPDYWKPGRAHFDEAVLLTIADVVARTNALTTGNVDVIDRVDIKTLHLLRRIKNIAVDETTGYAHYTFPMRTDTAPFDDNDVRLALKYAVDRDAILQTVLGGHGVIGNDHPISVANRFHASDLPQRGYDPDRARHHLKKAGISSLTVPIHAADAAFGGAVDAAVLYKEHAAKAGITLDVIREPNDGYWSNVWMQKPWCACYWSGRPTEDQMFSTAYAEGASWNDTFWSHDRFNKLLVEARATLDEAKRGEMYTEMQRIVRDEGGVVTPVFNNYVIARLDNVAHSGQLADNNDLDGGKLVERWWFA